jgi:predicted dehydrogenase
VINAALVGLGWWGRHILDSLRDSERIRVVRAIDQNPGAFDSLPNGHELPFSSELQDALDDVKIDAVILATPHSLHVEQTEACAAAGKHVFVEKPLALDQAGAQRAIDACERTGVQLGVGHERRFEPAMLEIEALLASGKLGTIMHVESNFSHDFLANIDPDDWRAAPDESPLPALTGMGIHLTDAYVHLFGPVDEVFTMSATRGKTWVSGDTFSVLLRFVSGVTGYINAILETPLFVRFQVFGSRGWVEARSDAHPAQPGVTQLSICAAGKSPETREVRYVDSVLANLEAFADAVAGQAPYPMPNAEKLANVALFEAIVASAATRSAVRLEN